MKRTVNKKALLTMCGVILSLGLIYLVGYLLPTSFKALSGTPPFNIFWERMLNGIMAILIFGMIICIMALIAVGICYLVGWVFPKKKINGE